jgi:hypothetical protein
MSIPKEEATVDEEDDFDDEDEDEDDVDEALQLGFAVPLDDLEGEELPMFDDDRDWSAWDGGRIGGRPFWLHPAELPAPKTLACPHCQEPMSFLLQIYCPLDDHTPAFHRMLYLFCCRRGPCARKEGSLLALRCQLPRANPFYVENVDDLDDEEGGDGSSSSGRGGSSITPKRHALCAVCGQSGPLQCNACKQVSYCCKSHQKLDWMAGHKGSCKVLREGGSGGAAAPSSSSLSSSSRHSFACVFPQYDIEVCSAVDMAEEGKNDEGGGGGGGGGAEGSEGSEGAGGGGSGGRAAREAVASAKAAELLKGLKRGSAKEGDAASSSSSSAESAAEQDEISSWTSKDVDEMTSRPGSEGGNSASRDPATRRFLIAVGANATCGDQILRYHRWPDSDGAVVLPSPSGTDEPMQQQKKRRNGGPLWVKSEGTIQEEEDDKGEGEANAADGSGGSSKKRLVPRCDRCGAARRFEFQVMPQLLHYVLKSSSAPSAAAEVPDSRQAAEEARAHLNEDTLDWGTLAVFTCTASCGGSSFRSSDETPAYTPEFVWRQSPI